VMPIGVRRVRLHECRSSTQETALEQRQKSEWPALMREDCINGQAPDSRTLRLSAVLQMTSKTS
jgi:hypothetical protein